MNSFAAIADPTRRQIVELLAKGPRSSSDIASRFAVSPSAISQHLKVLKTAKLVRAHVAAQRRIYELDRAGVDELSGWLDQIRLFWADKLDALETEMRKGRT
ncbi:ArsR/SmtB family transcription factor [Tepidicaulis sp. LMO-SS28]|uniref:ArsR/SmtB family transcription factor n=1 Tax=Tepidicaulis sp. LMO-SS28 TaxID=3447455 RepID=UPI003EE2C99F